MKKVILGILVTLAVLVIGGFVLSRVAENKLHAALEGIPGARIDFRKANLSPILGNLEFRDVEFALCDSTGASPDIEGRIEAIKLEKLRWRSLIQAEASAQRLLIREPQARLVLKGGEPDRQKDSTEQASAPSFLKKVSLSELRVEKGRIGLESQPDSLQAAAQDITVSIRDIGILLAENRVEYNDSTYSFALDSLDFTDPEGLFRIQIGHLATADAGPVEAQALHLYNCVPQEELAIRMGKVSAMWCDVRLDSLCTSPLNLPRMVQDQRIEIGSVSLSGPEIVLLQDDRYAPAVPYTTFQEGLNSLEMPLHIQEINARITAFTFIWETSHVNKGTFPMHNLRMAVKSASNAPGNLMEIGLKSGNHSQGTLDFSLLVRNDKKESTQGRMLIKNLDASRLDSFLRPLFGATAKADIHKIDSSFKGDKDQMKSEFCMTYDQLSLKTWKDVTAPFQIVAKNSGVVNFLANLVVPDSNPSKPGKEPKKVEYTFQRDPMLPYPSYIIQDLTLGMLKTVLPGGSVHKKKE